VPYVQGSLRRKRPREAGQGRPLRKRLAEMMVMMMTSRANPNSFLTSRSQRYCLGGHADASMSFSKCRLPDLLLLLVMK
jgi:hypothetical protein